jgi:hypothetical protein
LLRSLAYQTRFSESKMRSLALAESFDKLAEPIARPGAPANRPA